MASRLTDQLRAADSVGDRAALSSAIASFESITLAEMESVELMERVDAKYTLRDSRLSELLAAIADDYRVLEADGSRLVAYTTLYFDTPARDCYRDHHNGRANRCKYRMRSYGPSGPAFFEVKRKTNRGRTVKQRIPIPALRPTVAGAAAEWMQRGEDRRLDLAPQLWTSFSRVTLVGREGVERATIDVDIQFWDARRRRARAPGAAIVEVKQERHARQSPIRRQLRGMGVAPSELSKYCIGSALLDRSLKTNRFKAALRALDALCE